VNAIHGARERSRGNVTPVARKKKRVLSHMGKRRSAAIGGTGRKKKGLVSAGGKGGKVLSRRERMVGKKKGTNWAASREKGTDQAPLPW